MMRFMSLAQLAERRLLALRPPERPFAAPTRKGDKVLHCCVAEKADIFSSWLVYLSLVSINLTSEIRWQGKQPIGVTTEPTTTTLNSSLHQLGSPLHRSPPATAETSHLSRMDLQRQTHGNVSLPVHCLAEINALRYIRISLILGLSLIKQEREGG
jgi:hypothetical protein